MLRQYELVDRVLAYDPSADEDLLNRAYVFSLQAHGSQLRASGDPYFSHPVEVAGILTDLKLDAETIATAILHDTIEDTVATPEQVTRLFGPKVARLVDGVTKLSKIEGAQTENERAAENLRKFLLAMSDDIRVLLVKLADRLHNMRTLHFIKSPDKRRRIARETMDIYAPLAERIGLYGFMDELQALAFQQLEPEGYDTIVKRLEALRAAGGGDMVARISGGIRDLLAGAGIDADVRGREKRPYSIWRKLQAHRIAFENLPDVIAFRVVVPNVSACYRALGVIHQRWQAVPGRFKDFVSTPKRNGYRSLHTTVMHDKTRIEIQIRTPEMDREAEFGLAAHWAYKEGGDAAGPAPRAYPWLKELLDAVDQAASPEEVLEHTRLAMFQDQVFAFTPKGELIQLPAGACPVDFAYAVHTELGDTCVGAKVNGRVVTLRTPLANGDQVEILRSKAQHPDPAWESFVVSVKARTAVRRFVRQQERAQLLSLGRKLYDETVGRLKLPLSEDAVDTALGRLKLADRNALYLALARQTVGDTALLEAVLPGSTANLKPRRRGRSGTKNAISITGLTPGVAYALADCCHPIPGDRIVGIGRAGRGIEVHSIDCARLADPDGDAGEWLDLHWGDETGGGTARVSAVVHNQPGSLAAMTAILAHHGANIVNLNLTDRDRAFHTYVVDIEVDDLAHLTNIIAALRATKAVVTVERVKA
ncbi:MAG: bifunctional (p)ppGpp synthetase/guanosine-3',5'-bis(diphosphate) 3'-pyrophosphohydrolase [Sphingomonadaceae bacterium]|nr:bifunctional (p)ppGpp synthetase/guanosine-3',5'-bis(diphosphate) 3'-pyrophosphohydrolase [Sphingomonadaceae bacterium]